MLLIVLNFTLLIGISVYNFWQYELCDVFIELTKPVMALDDAGAFGRPFLFPLRALHLSNHRKPVDTDARRQPGAGRGETQKGAEGWKLSKWGWRGRKGGVHRQPGTTAGGSEGCERTRGVWRKEYREGASGGTDSGNGNAHQSIGGSQKSCAQQSQCQHCSVGTTVARVALPTSSQTLRHPRGSGCASASRRYRSRMCVMNFAGVARLAASSVPPCMPNT